MPKGQGTIILHKVQMQKQKLLLHIQFLHLNVEIRQRVSIRNVLGKHWVLWECCEPKNKFKYPAYLRIRVIHGHPTWRVYLKEGNIVTLRIFTDSLFPAWSARQTLVFSSLYFENNAVQSSGSDLRGRARIDHTEPRNGEQVGCSLYGSSGRRKNTENYNQNNEWGKYFCSITFQINLKSGEVALRKAKDRRIKLHY